jgi:hypothetical protein
MYAKAGHRGVIGRFCCRGGYKDDMRIRVQAIGMTHHTDGGMSDGSMVTGCPACSAGNYADLGLTFWPYCVS